MNIKCLIKKERFPQRKKLFKKKFNIFFIEFQPTEELHKKQGYKSF